MIGGVGARMVYIGEGTQKGHALTVAHRAFILLVLPVAGLRPRPALPHAPAALPIESAPCPCRPAREVYQCRAGLGVRGGRKPRAVGSSEFPRCFIAEFVVESEPGAAGTRP